MKNSIKLSTLMLIGIFISFSSCRKDDITPAPAVTINDGIGPQNHELTIKIIYIKIKAVAGNGRTIKSVMIERTVSGKSTATIYSTIPDKAEFEYIHGDDLTGLISAGSVVTYTIKVSDNKDVIITKTFTYTIVMTDGILVSNEIALGTQENLSNPYKFFGLTDNFARYTAGANGSARANSAKIDFVYYYGFTDENTIASPNNVDGAQVVWAGEIASWTTKNDTKFKNTSITFKQFDFIRDSTKVDDSFASIDFTGASGKVTNIIDTSVVAFQTSSGKKGLIKFINASPDNVGAIRLSVISQD